MPDATALTAPRANSVVVVLAAGGILVSLMYTLVIPLAPEFPRLLDTSPADAAWVITSTLLALAVATPVVGRLGDMYGKRRMLVVSLTLLVSGSVVCALADSLAPMVAGRAMQGLAGGVIALGISIMRDELPAGRLGSATALMSASLGVGGALGLPAATFVVERADWHVLFWASAGIGLVVTVLVLAVVPESPVRTCGHFDSVGALGLATALLCLLLAISQGAGWGWTSPRTTGLAAAAGVVLLLWGRWELRTSRPLVDLRTTVRRQVLLTNIASAVFGFAMFSTALVLPQLLLMPTSTGYGLGQTMLAVGVIMAPNGLIMMAMAPVSARISRTRGPRTTILAGAAVVAAGYALGVGLLSTVWQLVLVSCVIGAGVGLFYGAMPALIMAAVPVSETAAANSLNTLMRAIGTATSSAVTGVILAQLTTTFGVLTVPSLGGFRLIMGIGAAAAVATIVVAAFIPGRGTPVSLGRQAERVSGRVGEDAKGLATAG